MKAKIYPENIPEFFLDTETKEITCDVVIKSPLINVVSKLKGVIE